MKSYRAAILNEIMQPPSHVDKIDWEMYGYAAERSNKYPQVNVAYQPPTKDPLWTVPLLIAP